ncbi:MAG TPA: apolipoprotein A1/A4/E family protein [Candidatus Ruania gallistercoris]|uniref:Apolipoprotein A1/A4/E family protein n=1 Tax=Candidatus Ruania gallistercoris TaxID=2838746 RepID=A0A9D2EE57_9MICO|nr:apolipoprotein A1/A4/E family protein [Candidatus Ruania gallistercoris]
MTMDVWVSLGGVLVAVLALYAALSRPMKRLEADIGGLRGEVKADIGGLRGEVKADIGGLRSELKADIAALDERVTMVDERLRSVGANVVRLDERVARLDDRVVGVDSRLVRLDDRVAGLDDRVYALAVGLQPRLHRPEGSESRGATGSAG